MVLVCCAVICVSWLCSYMVSVVQLCGVICLCRYTVSVGCAAVWCWLVVQFYGASWLCSYILSVVCAVYGRPYNNVPPSPLVQNSKHPRWLYQSDAREHNTSNNEKSLTSIYLGNNQHTYHLIPGLKTIVKAHITPSHTHTHIHTNKRVLHTNCN
jgi:hypothetical protein